MTNLRARVLVGEVKKRTGTAWEWFGPKIKQALLAERLLAHFRLEESPLTGEILNDAYEILLEVAGIWEAP